MTKQAELDILRDAIRRLGPDSYCGPWLESVLFEIEQDIRSDVFPSVTMAGTMKQSEESLRDAHERAAEVIRHAESRADLIVAEAGRKREHVLAIRQRVAGVIHGAERELWNI